MSRIVLTKRGLVTDILKEDVQGLQQLNTHIAARFLPQDVQEENKHVLLQEEAGERMGKHQWFRSTFGHPNHSLSPCIVHMCPPIPQRHLQSGQIMPPAQPQLPCYPAPTMLDGQMQPSKLSAQNVRTVLDFWQEGKDLYLLNGYTVIYPCL